MDNILQNLSFQELKERLSINLNLPLPGMMAHQTMAASTRFALPMEPNIKTKKSAVLILFYPDAHQIKIPFILRPPYDGTHGGQVAFPGGRIEKNDENLTRTALREAQEEIGIRIADVQIIGQLTELFIPPSNYLVQPIIGYMHSKPVFYPDPREVETVFEVSFDELVNPLSITDELLDIKGIKINAPTYTFQNQKIWGATAMMIAELLMVIKNSK